jgi:hypothetical protein
MLLVFLLVFIDEGNDMDGTLGLRDFVGPEESE